ncbi:unnamed protein product [Heterobilharzia americana]|nr:unnamed protein product [Heterobilharzia americana]
MVVFKQFLVLQIILNVNVLSVLVVKDLTVGKFVRNFADSEALFGAPIIQGSLILGRIFLSNPLDGCVQKIPLPSNASDSSLPYISLIKRGNCSFVQKVSAAERGGYIAAVVYNVDDGIFPMSSNSSTVINISAIMISLSDGELVRNNYCTSDYFAEILPTRHRDITFYLIPLITCVLIVLVALGVAYIIRCWDRYRRRHRFCLPIKELHKIPETVFDKNSSQFEVCVICLEEYKDGEKLRVLPCKHAYHSKCVDPWLVKRRSCCPMCKKRVRSRPRINVSRFARLRRSSATISEAPLIDDSSFEEDSDSESSGSDHEQNTSYNRNSSADAFISVSNERTPLFNSCTSRLSDSKFERMKVAASICEDLEEILGDISVHDPGGVTASTHDLSRNISFTHTELQPQSSRTVNESIRKDVQWSKESISEQLENDTIIDNSMPSEVIHAEVHTDFDSCAHQSHV